jgi:hypothetical protein
MLGQILEHRFLAFVLCDWRKTEPANTRSTSLDQIDETWTVKGLVRDKVLKGIAPTIDHGNHDVVVQVGLVKGDIVESLWE